MGKEISQSLQDKQSGQNAINNKVITRFPPSPTGNFHIGGARTALFNYLFTKQAAKKGLEAKIILRFEDTDKERSKKEYEKNIQDGLDWLGLKLDETYRQSERTGIYKKYLKQMVESGHAYVSKEEAKEAGQRAEVIRFKNPNTKIAFQDLIRGTIEFDTTELKDFVIAKNLDEPLYHLAVVVDDHEMGITHVIRGEDHISNTPRQILIQRAIGASQPVYAHIPLILAPDRSKLSKRHGAVAVTEYQNAGYLPEAMNNYLALLGWNPGTDEEIMSLDQLIGKFDMEKVHKGGAIFSEEKLKWINKEYLKKIPVAEFIKMVRKSFSELYPDSSKIDFAKIAPLVLEHSSTLNDLKTAAKNFSYFVLKPTYEPEKLLWKNEKDRSKTGQRIQHVITLLEKLPSESFIQEKIKTAVWDYATAEGRGEVLWPVRMALSGAEKSPDPFTLSEILGKEETLARLNAAAVKLS